MTPGLETANHEANQTENDAFLSSKEEYSLNSLQRDDYVNSKDKLPERKFIPMLREFSGGTSLHGLNKVTDGTFSVVRRVIWLVLLIIGTILLIFTFGSQLNHFLDYSVQTIVTVEERQSLEFPAITICNYNMFRKSIATQNPATINKLKSLFPIPDEVDKDDTTSYYLRDSYLLSEEDYNITEELIELAHQFDDMILTCFWVGRRIRCRDYFSLSMTEFGVCYTFNGPESRERNGPLEVYDAGRDQGLLLRINIENEEYFYGESTSSGIQGLVHSHLEDPLVKQHGFAVAPGTTAMVVLHQKEDIFAKSPYGDCVDPRDPNFENPLEYYSNYSITACKVEHKTKFLAAKCGCRMFHDPGNISVCRTVREVQCIRKAKENYTHSAIQAMRWACPPTCVADSYSVTLSYAKFPSQHIVNQLTQTYNMSETMIMNNLLQLMVYFEDLGVHKIEQVPAYTGTSLFSDVGGQMGLCLGASLLTLIEIVEFLTLSAVRLCRRNGNHKVKA